MKSKRTSRRKSRKTMRGGFAGVSARYYYPQNMLVQDPQRDIQTSLLKGGCGCGMKTGGKRKNHSRKYYKKGGAGFFNNFGTVSGSVAAAGQVTGASAGPMEVKPSYLV